MKLYIIVYNHHNGNSPNNYKINCEIFLNKKSAIKFKKEKENEFLPIWYGDYNYVEMFEKKI